MPSLREPDAFPAEWQYDMHGQGLAQGDEVLELCWQAGLCLTFSVQS